MKLLIYFKFGFLLTVIVISAYPNYIQLKDTKCSVLNDNKLSQINDLLETSKNDTASHQINFLIDYSRKGYYLIDKKNKWELNFSDKYFDIEVKYLDSNYVILYCAVSGIMSGLTSSPITHNNLYIVNRKNGKKELNIISEKGIISAIIKDDTLFFRCHKPDVVRYFKW